MAALATDHRNRLESTVKAARVAAEAGARQAVEALAVDRNRPFDSMTAEEKDLRRRLRSHGRQIGDTLNPDSGIQTIHRLVREVAYEHWHRMLFARFLAENELLIEPETGVAITLEECADLARGRASDPWVLAASFAERMLPQIFRADDPALAVTLPPETRQTLQELLARLPSVIFTEDDSLGWTYQFWQSAEKEAVNARARSGEKITGDTLPAVTQLFTEPYMVDFLLDNTIGGWHAGRVLTDGVRDQSPSEAGLREAVRIDQAGGYEFEFLRFVREWQATDEESEEGSGTGPWRPAAGTFERWPDSARELTILDPCCGSGHFLVAAFSLLTRLRMQEEGFSREAAAQAVIRENLFGLELDPRCTQIAAFNLALAAWKFVGRHIDLPPVQIACSGYAPNSSKEEWLAIAEDGAVVGGMAGKRDLFGSDNTLLTAALRGGLEALYGLFQQAPELGSLIDPSSIGGRDQADAFQAGITDMESVLDKVLAQEEASGEQRERAVAAKGMATAARILMGPPGGYTLVITNVPYLKGGSIGAGLRTFIEQNYPRSKADLATVFVERSLQAVRLGGVSAVVTQQYWLSLGSYQELRKRLLSKESVPLIARLGPNAFGTVGGAVVNVCLQVIERVDPVDADMAILNIDETASPTEKARLLRHGDVARFSQAGQLHNPDSRIISADAFRHGDIALLSKHADFGKGSVTGDSPHYLRKFWEFDTRPAGTVLWLNSPDGTDPYSGREHVALWEMERHNIRSERGFRFHGQRVFGKMGVALGKAGSIRPAVYTGEIFDDNVAVVMPYEDEHVVPTWAFCNSDEFVAALRALDSKMSITAGTFTKVPFELDRWREVAHETYPDGLPEPYSDDPTQWLFHGHPAYAERGTELHVGLARLLGYRWPAESDPEMRLSDSARALIAKSKELDAQGFTDADGIVCLSPVRGEPSAAARLRRLMAAAFGPAWTTNSERELLWSTAAAEHGKGRPAGSLDGWLQKSFFEEHCRLFHQRPFVWHIWDGLRDGFNALVNYHRLAGWDGQGRRTLESLTYTYLGEWIDRQRQAQKDGAEGADTKVAAALRLQGELEKILEGGPPYDIFVRWKPLHEQALGWDPDLEDGVQLNIRPFMLAGDVGRKGGGVLRGNPNCKWTPDRGKESRSLRPAEDFPWFWGCDPKNKTAHRVDFGADTPGAVPAGEKFDGKRWNELHYSRAAKQAARRARTAGEST